MSAHTWFVLVDAFVFLDLIALDFAFHLRISREEST